VIKRALAILLLSASCANPRSHQAEPTEGQAPLAPTGIEESREPSAESQPSADQGEGEGTGEHVPSEGIVRQDPPDIFEAMAAAGFTRLSEDDLADYLPIPPRSQGQMGRFSLADDPGDSGTVTVARVTYHAPVFADPHDRWLRERIGLLTNRHERVVREGATVIHIDAESEALAERAVAAFDLGQTTTD